MDTQYIGEDPVAFISYIGRPSPASTISFHQRRDVMRKKQAEVTICEQKYNKKYKNTAE